MNEGRMGKSGKIRVAVLFGGRSGEHEVSVISATNVIQNLDRTLFDVVPIGIDKQGGWFLGDDIYQRELSAPVVLQLQRDIQRQLFHPDFIGKNVQQVQPKDLFPNSKKNERIFDVIFPVIHGPLCEDGTVQGLLELAEVPYVGCGVLSSAVGMDKDFSKRLMHGTNIAVPDFVVIKRGEWNKNSARCSDFIKQKLVLPVFVKPANTGSSVGVQKVKRYEDLTRAITSAFLYDTKVIIEQGIDAAEIEVAVLESLDYGAEPLVSVVGEVRPSSAHEFYSYDSKYVDEKGAELIIPAPISEELQKQFQQAAKDIFMMLDCEGMARVDFLLERRTHKIYFNEINTIPGFTQISMYPKLMAASGMSYPKLLTHLVMLAIERHARKSQLHREYVSA
jgi:D-alanine-D-alanine ligase